MNIYRRKVTGSEIVVSVFEKVISEKTYKLGGGEVVKKVTTRTQVHMLLECGHSRVQHPGERDITKAKHLDCYKCSSADRDLLRSSL